MYMIVGAEDTVPYYSLQSGTDLIQNGVQTFFGEEIVPCRGRLHLKR